MTLRIAFDNSYARLPERFYVRQAPVPVCEPELLLLNRALAAELDIDADALLSPNGVAMLAGNVAPEGSDPLAQAYSGHQFGGFSPVLGDGRAMLLGEVVDRSGERRDLQLKGSGPTAFSRPGSDGRAPLGPVIREFILSEAMYALGIPTTRSLAAVATGETVWRQGTEPGGVLTRVASSHIRVGTFQYFAARQDHEALRILTDHVIARHYPQADGPLGLLKAVIARQAHLVAKWMGVGFIHGVMNTDNTSIAGETIDYGPCAFMDTFHPGTVYSSIDRSGRYAYDKQPGILGWNLAQFASCLVPLLGENEEVAIELAQDAVQTFTDLVQDAWNQVFCDKIGLVTAEPDDNNLVGALLGHMVQGQADFTNTFRNLASGSARDEFTDATAFDQWEALWKERLSREPEPEGLTQRLKSNNPAIIPRNHRVQQAIDAIESGDLAPAVRLIGALAKPFDEPTSDLRNLTFPPKDDERIHNTFCGT